MNGTVQFWIANEIWMAAFLGDISRNKLPGMSNAYLGLAH